MKNADWYQTRKRSQDRLYVTQNIPIKMEDRMKNLKLKNMRNKTNLTYFEWMSISVIKIINNMLAESRPELRSSESPIIFRLRNTNKMWNEKVKTVKGIEETGLGVGS